jgi:hypothetical protein
VRRMVGRVRILWSFKGGVDDSDDDVYLYKNYNERVSQNLYSIRVHTDQPKTHNYGRLGKGAGSRYTRQVGKSWHKWRRGPERGFRSIFN